MVRLVSALFALRALRDVPVPPPGPEKEKPEKAAEPAFGEAMAEV